MNFHINGRSRGRSLSDAALAYVIGELDPKDAAEFERRMEGDELLRSEVEEWRGVRRMASDWAAKDVGDLGASKYDSLRRAVVSEYSLHGPQPHHPRRFAWFFHLVQPSLRVRSAFAWALTVALIIFSAVVVWRNVIRPRTTHEPNAVHEGGTPQKDKPWGTLHFPP